MNTQAKKEVNMDFQRSLFDGDLVCLAPIDPENDAEVEAGWTHNAQYLRLLGFEPARPLSAYQIRQKYENIEKKMEEHKNMFYFNIRKREDDRLVGFTKIFWVAWTHGSAFVQLGIGAPKDRGLGYGNEALQLLLHYAFEELNLFRLTALVPGYNQPAIGLFEKSGFKEEVRRRQALNRDSQRFDIIDFGLLVDEWRSREDQQLKPVV
jgi:RimJ/RimL family protein N-acetyltransferase